MLSLLCCSFIERLTSNFEYMGLLTAAAASKDPVDRMRYVVAFAVSGLCRQVSFHKPFNPSEFRAVSASIRMTWCALDNAGQYVALSGFAGTIDTWPSPGFAAHTSSPGSCCINISSPRTRPMLQYLCPHTCCFLCTCSPWRDIPGALQQRHRGVLRADQPPSSCQLMAAV